MPQQLPLYLCHKTVRAAKIAYVIASEEATTVMLAGESGTRVYGATELQGKPTPESGWYLVEYGDGYFSFSPASTFEAGYTLAM